MGRSGLSTFDLLGDMPSGNRTLMRLFLRNVEMSMDDLRAAMANLPEEKRLTDEQLAEAVQSLLDQGWVGQIEKKGKMVYSVQQQSR